MREGVCKGVRGKSKAEGFLGVISGAGESGWRAWRGRVVSARECPLAATRGA